MVLPDGKDEYELEVEDKEIEGLDPASSEGPELDKCLYARIVPDAYRNVISDMEVVEVRRKVKDEAVQKVESPYGFEEEMKVRAGEGYFVREPERDLVYCPSGEILREKSIKKNGATRCANKHVCGRCPYKGKCITGKGVTR